MRHYSSRVRIFVLIGILFLTVSSVYAETAEDYYKQGQAAITQGDIEKASFCFTKAIGLKPDYADAYFFRGGTYVGLQKFEQGISDFTKAIELKHDDAVTYGFRGAAYLKLNNYSQAIADFTKAIELKSDGAALYYSRSLCYFYEKEYDKALDDLNKAEALGYGQVDNAQKARLLELKKELKEASGRDKEVYITDKKVIHC